MSATVCPCRVSLGLFPGSPELRLYDCTVGALRLWHDSRRTEQVFIQWLQTLGQFEQERHQCNPPDRRCLENFIIRTAQGRLSHRDVRPNMIHTYVCEPGGCGLHSSADTLPSPRYMINGNSLSRIGTDKNHANN
ncbi:MAG: hypothetical protein KatS3mg109_0277 [Pirellulaceae bacterium]|nr:MAG: hypothetical protein KatS3mg109_0277 [Pirellulaceae bacterium]